MLEILLLLESLQRTNIHGTEAQCMAIQESLVTMAAKLVGRCSTEDDAKPSEVLAAIKKFTKKCKKGK